MIAPSNLESLHLTVSRQLLHRLTNADLGNLHRTITLIFLHSHHGEAAPCLRNSLQDVRHSMWVASRHADDILGARRKGFYRLFTQRDCLRLIRREGTAFSLKACGYFEFTCGYAYDHDFRLRLVRRITNDVFLSLVRHEMLTRKRRASFLASLPVIINYFRRGSVEAPSAKCLCSTAIPL
ncbi:hypothetical protein K443DRAFT_244503 [Laccaria amethystina LaAM-08-1]|uniref:Uncharacterized protein n=1 Tax=Laccaria amethystina LaAM-08-1 TaxID=1095629 RepID=A0A0C9WXI0_9AGAR|nr:hypothetical protein K443DRAFT_244503 [Laccaria amethystina LaAM-08-1]